MLPTIEDLAATLYKNRRRTGVENDFTVDIREGLKIKVAKNALDEFPNGKIEIQEIHELRIPPNSRQGVLTYFDTTTMAIIFSDVNPERLKLELHRHGARNTDVLQIVEMDQFLNVEIIHSGNLPTRLAHEDTAYGKALRIDDLTGNLSYLITGKNLDTTLERWGDALPAWKLQEVMLNSDNI